MLALLLPLLAGFHLHRHHPCSGHAGEVCSAPQDFAPDPWSTTDPRTLGFRTVERSKTAPVEETWMHPDLTPKPTAEWWENMVLTKGDINGNGNGFVIPYIVDPKPYGIKIAIPFPLAVSETIYENGFDTLVLVTNFGAGANFDGGYKVVRSDKLSLDLVWGKPGEGMKCILMRGSPYLTCEYDGIKPAFNAPQMMTTFTVDDEPANCKEGPHTGSRFLLSFVQSDETWIIYSEFPITMACESDASWSSLQATEPFQGVVRAALGNNCTSGRSAFHCDAMPPLAKPSPPVFVKHLDAHAHVYAVGAELSFSKDEATGTGAVHYQWEKRAFNGTDASTPLIFHQMVHHRLTEVVGSELLEPDLHSSVSIHGPSWLAAGDEWAVTYKLPEVMWHPPRPVRADRLDEVVKQLEADKDFLPPLNYQLGAGDPYNAGKMLSRMARVALIAEHVERKDIADHVLDLLQPLADMYLNASAANYFLYDASWGGLISCGCVYDDCGGKCLPHCNKGGDEDFCPCLTDPGMDFGNGFYNDHHFHYGYHLYAYATLAHFRPEWAAKNKEKILLFARDFANPSEDDKHFPVWRNKDWYLGFSWASGIALAAGQPFRNGRNQESTSESINAYYALQLLGDALGDDRMRTIGQIATAAELHSADTYWHMDEHSVVYPEIIKKNKIMGILWQNLAQYQTWFGGQPFMVHGIQIIPITPISELNHHLHWTCQEYPLFKKSCGGGGQCLTDGWITFVTLDRAVFDPDGAWKEAIALSDSVFSGQSPAGNGNSRANTLHWIATRPENVSCEDDDGADGHKHLQASLGPAPRGRTPAHWGIRAASVGLVGLAVVGVASALLATRVRAQLGPLLRRRAAAGEGTAEVLLQDRIAPEPTGRWEEAPYPPAAVRANYPHHICHDRE